MTKSRHVRDYRQSLVGKGDIRKLNKTKELNRRGSLLNRKTFGWWRLERSAGRFCDFTVVLA